MKDRGGRDWGELTKEQGDSHRDDHRCSKRDPHVSRDLTLAGTKASNPHRAAEVGCQEPSLTREQLERSEHSMPEMTAEELRAIARELNAYVKLYPGKHEARSLAIRCGEFAELLAPPTATRLIEPGSEGIETGSSA
jgi:hypothetical protein